MLRHARRLDLPGTELKRLVYIGDTKLNDGTAFRNLCTAGPWQGWAFIGRDDVQAPLQFEAGDGLYVANRWSALTDFVSFLEEQRFVVDEATAVVIDVDKTAVGARGRNDEVIDEARVEAVERTVASLLGSDFDKVAFRTAYDHLNQPAYHTFTADNQDYLAYICLMLGAGLVRFAALLDEIEAGVIYGSVVQKSYMEMFLAVHLLYWLHNDLLKVLPDWQAAGVNILPDQVQTGVMSVTQETVSQYRHQ
jgi:hypothetical protein